MDFKERMKRMNDLADEIKREAEQIVQERQGCSGCYGSGKCPCQSAPYCARCEGTGVCQECAGKGSK